MSDIIVCSKCGVKMTERQEKSQIRCLVIACPLPNAAAHGKEYADASQKNRKNLHGVIFAMNGHQTYNLNDYVSLPGGDKLEFDAELTVKLAL